MNLNRVSTLLSVLICTCFATLFGQPRVDTLVVPTSERVMDEVTLSVIPNAEDSALGLSYQWSIEQAPSSLGPVLVNDTGRRASLQLYWISPDTADQAVGESITVKVRVSFTDPANGETPFETSANIQITGVNHPPTPVISGNLGGPGARIPTGQSIQVNSFGSTDPDGDSFRADWALGTVKGGVYIQPAVLYGAEGAIASFPIPAMTAEINQELLLHLTDGLHRVTKSAIAYLTPTATQPPGTNTAPTLTLSTESLSLIHGQNVNVAATSVDSNGDNLAFAWLLGSTPISPEYVTSFKSNATTWQSSLQYPTTELDPGTYSFSVQAVETATAAKLQSPKRFFTVTVNSGNIGTDPGFFDIQQSACESNAGPSLVSISPDPRDGEIFLPDGEAANVEIIFSDATQRASPLGGYQTGVASAAWDVSQLLEKGISPSASGPQPTSTATQSRLLLSFQTPEGTSGEARVFVTVADVLDCTTTVGFGLNFEGNSNPEVDAGPDQEAQSGNQVVLTGSGNDPDGDSLAFTWLQTDDTTQAPGVELVDANSAVAAFTAPEVAEVSVLHFSLTARDGRGGENADTVQVTVRPPSQAVEILAPVSLEGIPYANDTFVGVAIANPTGAVATLHTRPAHD